MPKILIFENATDWRDVLSQALAPQFALVFQTNEKNLLEPLKKQHCDAIILDLPVHKEDPFETLDKVIANHPAVPVIITCELEKAELVVKSIKKGAFDFVPKPFTEVRIKHVVDKALETKRLQNEIHYLRGAQDIIYNFDDLIAESASMKAVIHTLKKFAQTDSTILMTGETGTGKSFFSGSIHFNSHRKDRPFITINCANIPENLLESELFGHEKGAFTGAEKQRIGRFEQANGGTIFLDEIGEIGFQVQAKLLRVIEEKAFERVGGNQTIHVDVRVIAATNRSLETLILEGKFREDLYYRINILHITLPPLRKRNEGIESIATFLLKKICRSLKKDIKGFSPNAMEWIKAYHWPGNIRQLANTIERAVILEESDVLSLENIEITELDKQQDHATVPLPAPSDTTHRLSVAQPPEYERILKALEKSLWIQKDAANLLGISPRNLNYKVKKYGIKHPRWRKNK